MEGSTQVERPVPYGTNRLPNLLLASLEEEKNERKYSIATSSSPRSKISFLAGTLPRSHAQFSRENDQILNENLLFLIENRLFPQVSWL